MNGDLENHLQARSFRLVEWSNIVFLLRRTSQDSNLVGKFYLTYSSDMYCSRGGIWKGDITVADIEEVENLDVSEIHARRPGFPEIHLSPGSPCTCRSAQR